jgi:hypothetical protein
MDKIEILYELDMPYNELVMYLLNKYGASQYDYFTNENCTSKCKKISRTEEGLLCHHIDEDKAPCLSDKKSAIKYPFNYQKADRLVYCNYLEHLILHIHIGIETFWRQYKELNQVINIPGLINTGAGVIVEEINTLFANNGSSVIWKQRCFDNIKDNYEEYIYILKWLFDYIERNYKKGKNEFTIEQVINHPQFGSGIITGFSVKPIDIICVKFKDGEKKIARTFMEKILYDERVRGLKENLSRISNGEIFQCTLDSLL